MAISAVELHQIALPFRRPFAHALHERRHSDVVIVVVVDDAGRRGFGEIVPRPYVTGESIDSVMQVHGPKLARGLLSAEVDDLEQVAAWLGAARPPAREGLATLCGFDLALVDVVGQRHNVSLATTLGGVCCAARPPGVVVGFEVETDVLARYCATLRLSGRTFVKVKVGRDDDERRLAEVARVFKRTALRLDANAAWTAGQAVARLRALAEVAEIASIEQPVAADDVAGMAQVFAQTQIPVMADEAVCSLADARRLHEGAAAQIFNIRLGKTGGTMAAAELCRWAAARGIGLHLGTMVGETSVLSRASEVFGRCIRGFECLDGAGQHRFLLEVDIAANSGEHPAGPNAPGLGIRIDEGRIATHRVGEPLRFTYD